MDDVSQKEATVVVGTFGRQSWIRLAERRALPSAGKQGVRVIHEHGETLAQARNAALAQVETEFVIHLDADDELEPGYVEAMMAGSGDVRVPMLRQVVVSTTRFVQQPFWPRVYGHEHDCVAECLRFGNWIIIGAAVRTEMARAHGWEEFGWSEDWAMWARCWKGGATFERIPDAIYRAYRRPGGRNQQANGTIVNWHKRIEAAVWPDEESTVV